MDELVWVSLVITLRGQISFVSVVEKPVVLIIGDHVQDAHLFCTPVQNQQVFQSEGSVVFLLVFLKLRSEH